MPQPQRAAAGLRGDRGGRRGRHHRRRIGCDEEGPPTPVPLLPSLRLASPPTDRASLRPAPAPARSTPLWGPAAHVGPPRRQHTSPPSAARASAAAAPHAGGDAQRGRPAHRARLAVVVQVAVLFRGRTRRGGPALGATPTSSGGGGDWGKAGGGGGEGGRMARVWEGAPVAMAMASAGRDIVRG